MPESTHFQVLNKICISTYTVPGLQNHDQLTIGYL